MVGQPTLREDPDPSDHEDTLWELLMAWLDGEEG